MAARSTDKVEPVLHMKRVLRWRRLREKLPQPQRNFFRILPTACSSCPLGPRRPTTYHSYRRTTSGRLPPGTSEATSPVTLSPHHRTWWSWAEILTEDSDVSTLAEANCSSPSSPEPEIPLSQVTLPSARPRSSPLPKWLFGDEPELIQYIWDHVLPQPGKSHPPVPTAQLERARREAEIDSIMEKLKAEHRERYEPKRLSYEERVKQQSDTKKLEALYIRMLDYIREGEAPIERQRVTVVKFDKARGFGTLLDCRHGGTILVNRRAIQRDYLPKSYHSLEWGENVDYTPVQSLRGEWVAAVTSPKNPTQLPFTYFLSDDWEADPHGIRPMRLPNTADEEEGFRAPVMHPKYLPKSYSSAAAPAEDVPRPTPPEEVWPKQWAPTTDVPRPTPCPEVWPDQQAPTEVPHPTPLKEVRPDQPAPTVFLVTSAAAINFVVSVNPSVSQSRLTNVSWDTAIHPMRESSPHAPRYMSQSKKQSDRLFCS
ncbi:uncharacterized protein LOC130276921 [Hyla sarda]|uniref:uncharacterized protein LOC130276921 n=1 Tax=Hyla sarda TaxID=327740 RepID=UPI0024C27DAF|nr:uncharacterized protein LOC130276921 [Hyla sarda]